MLYYKSALGNVEYYDEKLFVTKTIDPTMLFILGLEAITTKYNELKPDYIFIPKQVTIDDETYTISLFEEIVNYLSLNLINYNLSDDYIEIPCNGLKEFLNQLTSTGDNRVVPLLFHNLDDSSSANIEFPITDFDKHSEKIINILQMAGYCKPNSTIKLLGKRFSSDKDLISAINLFNKSLKEDHYNKRITGQIYKLLDNKAMYAYSLGVLYWCSCIGYDENLIYRVSPDSWYDGNYNNLVNTAWNVFRFHHAHPICCIDNDPKLYFKYKGIQNNKLWNFSDSGIEIKSDEILCNSLMIDENNNFISYPIFYSASTGNSPGSYSDLTSNIWKQLDSSVLCSDPKIGIVSESDDYIIRYIANDEVLISKAYNYNKNKYLSPNSSDLYFVYTGNLGWVNYRENSYTEYSDSNPILQLIPVGFDNISSDNLKLARELNSNEIIAYYQCYVTDDKSRSLYGILPNELISTGIIVENDIHFKYILSDLLFADKYEFIELTDYTLMPYYNVATPISIYIYNEDDSLMWSGTDTPISIVNYGYTKTPSEALDTYIDSFNEVPDTFDLRYNSDSEYGYWSNTWEPREWRSSIIDDIYLKNNYEISLYKNSSIIATVDSYTNLKESDDLTYIFNNQTISELSLLQHGFISVYFSDTVDNVYNVGITTYPCEIIYKDDFGNSLLDDNGNPLVWYDSENDKYWNGLFNKNIWQDLKPSKFNVYMYNSESNILKLVNDDSENSIIYIDNESISYSEFYNDPANGIVREHTKVFNNEVSSEILDCYVDTHSNKYCIPTITGWINRSDISNLGFKFVDGISVLYLCDNSIDLVYDLDPTD